jgi:pyruvate/2-oxoglutarate dehydrogenase complex dihydrolipoamide acyltransferase (E2) component
MMTYIVVPELLGSKLELLFWHKPDGSVVDAGDTLADISIEGSPAMTDCTIELPSPSAGRFAMLVASGSLVLPGQQIGTIEG